MGQPNARAIDVNDALLSKLTQSFGQVKHSQTHLVPNVHDVFDTAFAELQMLDNDPNLKVAASQSAPFSPAKVGTILPYHAPN